MSAIFGALSLGTGALAPDLGARMQQALVHRPADASGQHQLGACLLGARMRWLTAELSARTPPYIDRDRAVMCVADVRLDARESLASELGLAHPDELCDEALIVAAYLRWGSAFAGHLLGDFAIALWDEPAQRLLLARDVYGLRGLYCAQARDVLVFASQAKPLFEHPSISRAADPLRVAQYLARDFGDAERSFFRDVRRVLPGHVLLVERGQTRLERYFSLDPSRELSLSSSAEYSALFRETFLSAVRVRTRALGPSGCMLSGGLDSSGVLGAMHELAPGRDVPCFSARFPDFPAIDEGSWLDLHRARGGLAMHELRADRIGPLDDVDVLHDALDEPFHAPNLFIYYQLARLAKERGVQVLLDGLDGDTVVEHGLFFLHELLHDGKLRRLSRELRALHARTGFSYTELLRVWTLGPDVDRLRARAERLGWVHHGYLSSDFARQSGFSDYASARAEQALAAPSSFRDMHHRALSAPIMPFYMEVHDKTAAALGVDHRHPFFDRRLLELCLALPPEQRLHDGWDRVIERRAFEGLVPDAIRARQSKSVWTLNFQRQLFDRHAELIRACLESHSGPLTALTDLKRLRRDRRRLETGAAPERVLDLWCAVTLGIWMQRSNVTL